MMTLTSPRHEFDFVEDKSCFRAQCNCLCGTGSCRFCCRGCPPAKESTITRIVYIFFLVIIVLVMAMFMSEFVQNGIMAMFPDKNSVCKWFGAGLNCHAGKLMGYLVVYRIGFAVSLYHLILMGSAFGVQSSKEWRAAFHNGLWIYKFMLLVVLILLAFFIPDPRDHFITAWMYIAMTGAAGFIVIQLILIVFMVHKWTDKIQEKVIKGESAVVWYSVLGPSFALFIFMMSIAGICLLFIYFAGEGCYRNQWFIMINAGGCVIVSIVAALRRDPKPVGLRLLHASLISLYVIYLTWMAISSAPRKFQRLQRPDYSSRGEFLSRFKMESNVMSFQQDFYCGPFGDEGTWIDELIPYVSFIITFITIIYGSLGISEPEQCQALALPGCPPVEQIKSAHEFEDVGGQIITRNEKISVKYSYSLFHLMITLSCLLMVMHLTEWHTPTQASLMSFGRSWSTVWIKMSSSWVCLFIYFVTVLCPSILPLRKEMSVAPVIVEMNGYALDNEEDGVDAESFDEEAVPLKRINRPTIIAPHLETTV